MMERSNLIPKENIVMADSISLPSFNEYDINIDNVESIDDIKLIIKLIVGGNIINVSSSISPNKIPERLLVRKDDGNV